MSYSWFPLDNAAKIFPAVTTDEHTTVFRLSAILNQSVSYPKLLNAIAGIEKRFPYFKVCLKRGFFWYYLEYLDLPIVPVMDAGPLCRAINKPAGNPFLFRIMVRNTQISIEFSHILTDGSGALRYFSALLLAYFNDSDVIPKINIPIPEEEFEDAYNRYFKSEIPPVIKQSKAFHLPFKLNSKPRFKVHLVKVSIKEMKEKAGLFEISITDYLVSVYLFVLQEIYLELPAYKRKTSRKLIRIQVPVNLRNIYSTRSMRNFSLFVLPEIDLRLGYYTFDEIVKIVHYEMKAETERKLINKIISRNVKSEKNPFVRGIPLFLKEMILRYKYYSQGANQYSGVITNLGKFEIPDHVNSRIKNVIFIPPPPNKKLKINCGLIGFNDHLILSFGNITWSRQLEQKFVKFLTSNDIKVKLIDY